MSIDNVLDQAETNCANASSINEWSQHFLWNVSSSNYRVWLFFVVLLFAWFMCMSFLVRNITLWISAVASRFLYVIFIIIMPLPPNTVTVLVKALFLGCSIVPFIRSFGCSSGQILLPRYLINSLNNFQ